LKIGIAGTGRMGGAIAGRLLGLGHEVTVWNRALEKTSALSAAGARVAATPAQLASVSEFILTSLTNAVAIDAVYHGAQGLLAQRVDGKLFVEMSTVRPDTIKALAPKVVARGAAFVECPVGGTVMPAMNGKLLGFVGGDAADVARARPLLEQLCRRVEHLGPAGAGASVKLASNLPLLVYWQALGEALLLCRPLGLDAARLMDIFGDTAGGPNVLKVRGANIVEEWNGKYSGPVTFDVDSVRKDLHSMIDEARSLGGSLPLAERALQCFDQASREGLAGQDAVALPVHWARRQTA
jgi:3-hydroxyisobutyrate dehydrogenase